MSGDGMTCACGDVYDEHFDDDENFGPCQCDGCGCVYFEADYDA